MKKELIYRGNIPFVRLLIFLISGIIFGYFIEPNLIIYNYLLVFLASFFLIIILNQLFKNKKHIYYSGLLFFLNLFLLGWVLQWKGDPKLTFNHFSHFKTDALLGVINEEPKDTGKYLRFEFKTKTAYLNKNQIPVSGLLLVNIKKDSLQSNLKYGDVLLIPSYYQQVSPPYNPNSFDYKAYLANNMIWHSAFIEQDKIVKLKEHQGSLIIQYAYQFRQRMIRKFEYYLVNKSSLQIASALVLGYRNELEKEVMNTFTATGTVHVLAVSGLHVGIVFVVFSALLFWMNRNVRTKIIKGILLILLVWFYALITGFSPSVLRASIMISFALIGLHFVKGGSIYNSIASSAFLLLIYNPKFLSHVGFQLSYLAVIAIVYLYPKLRDLWPIKNRVLQWLWNYSALSISAQLITFPLVVYYFNSFPLYFLPANLFIIIPATFIVYLGFALLVVPYGFLAKYIAIALNALIAFSKYILEWFSQLPYASLSGISINPLQVILLYGFLCSLIFAFIVKKKHLFFGALLMMISLSLFRIEEYFKLQNRSEIRIYNVNQHLAIGVFSHKESILYADSIFLSTKSFHYLVESIAVKNKVNAVNALSFPSSYRQENLLIENNIVQISDKRIFILDEKFETNEIIVVDILLLRNNVKFDLQDIRRKIHFKNLLLDGSNYNSTIAQYTTQAEELSIPYYILKNNFAYVW